MEKENERTKKVTLEAKPSLHKEKKIRQIFNGGIRSMYISRRMLFAAGGNTQIVYTLMSLALYIL